MSRLRTTYANKSSPQSSRGRSSSRSGVSVLFLSCHAHHPKFCNRQGPDALAAIHLDRKLLRVLRFPSSPILCPPKSLPSREKLLSKTFGKLGREIGADVSLGVRNSNALQYLLHRFRRPVLSHPEVPRTPPPVHQHHLSSACRAWLPRAPSLHLDYPQSVG